MHSSIIPPRLWNCDLHSICLNCSQKWQKDTLISVAQQVRIHGTGKITDQIAREITLICRTHFSEKAQVLRSNQRVHANGRTLNRLSTIRQLILPSGLDPITTYFLFPGCMHLSSVTSIYDYRLEKVSERKSGNVLAPMFCYFRHRPWNFCSNVADTQLCSQLGVLPIIAFTVLERRRKC